MSMVKIVIKLFCQNYVSRSLIHAALKLLVIMGKIVATIWRSSSFGSIIVIAMVQRDRKQEAQSKAPVESLRLLDEINHTKKIKKCENVIQTWIHIDWNYSFTKKTMLYIEHLFQKICSSVPEKILSTVKFIFILMYMIQKCLISAL